MPTSATRSNTPILILGALFFLFGFVTWLNGTLIPYLKLACELNNFQSMLVAFAFYISYFVMALPSSFVLQKTGLRRGMMLGLIIMAVGALIFIPAAQLREYGLFLLGLFVIGSGLSLLQTASNPYITIVGPIESAARRISIMGICNKVAGVLAPLILGALILADADKLEHSLLIAPEGKKEMFLDELAGRVILPYTAMAGILVLLAVFVRMSPLPELEIENEDKKSGKGQGSVLSHPQLVLGVIALFLYVGAEVIAGDTIGSFGRSQGIPLSESRAFTSYTLIAMVVGYIIGIAAIPRWLSQQRALAFSAVTGIVFTLLAVSSSGYWAVLWIALLGLANALVWPAIWPLALDGVGKQLKTGSALLIMAIAGGALLPLLYGKLADLAAIGSQKAYLMLIPCYLFILYFAVSGYKLRRK
ncbi:MAG: sugar MFS transporter [Bacteroidetes bacterium]|nr:sugar MFS transporter [Bacteroidota bacterium]